VVVELREEVYTAMEETNPEPIEDIEVPEPTTPSFLPAARKRPSLVAPWGKSKASEPPSKVPEPEEPEDFDELEPVQELSAPTAAADSEPPKLKLGVKATGAQNELSLDSAPRGRFEGETPNVFEGEDLDLPPFLRKKK
jgi:hypothetical protein